MVIGLITNARLPKNRITFVMFVAIRLFWVWLFQGMTVGLFR